MENVISHRSFWFVAAFLLAAAVLLTMALTVGGASAVPCTPDDPGDATGNGYIDAGDITKVERIILTFDTETPGADANEDSSVDATDIGVIEYMILEIWPWKQVYLQAYDEDWNPVSESGGRTNFTVVVHFTYVPDFDASNYDILYDNTVLDLTNVTDGLMKTTPQGDAETVPVSNWGFIPSGQQGKVRIINNMPGAVGYNGSGTLAVLHFYVNTSACLSSDIDFNFNASYAPKLFDSSAAEIPSVTWINASQFSVDPCSEPTPSPTPTASASPTATASATATPTSTATASPTATATSTASPTATSTASPSPSPSPTATATASPSATPTSTATASPSATPTSTATASPTPTPTATATVVGDEVSIYFEDDAINVTGDCGEFTTDILITAPIDFFYGCQYRLAWNASLFFLQPEGYYVNLSGPIDMRGRVCTTEACGAVPPPSKYVWSEAVVVNPTGSQYCPQKYHRNMFWTDWYATTHAMGCANFVSTWSLSGGSGLSVREHTLGTNENRLIRLHWITSGDCSYDGFDYGTTANYGTTEIVFWPVGALDGGQGLMCACTNASRVPPEYDLEDVYTLHWVNASVTVE